MSESERKEMIVVKLQSSPSERLLLMRLEGRNTKLTKSIKLISVSMGCIIIVLHDIKFHLSLAALLTLAQLTTQKHTHLPIATEIYICLCVSVYTIDKVSYVTTAETNKIPAYLF